MKKNIYIIIESAKRELDCRILLALKLLKKNYNVVIGHKGSLFHIIDKFQPGAIFFKSLGPRNSEIIKYLKTNNFKVVACDEELLASTSIDQIVDYRITKESFENIDLLFAVGDYDANAIKQKFNNKEKIKLVGNLRLDILRDPINKIYEKEVKYIKSKYGSYFLLGTQFGRINAQNKNNDFMIDSVFSLMSEGHKADSKIVKSYKEVFKYQRENMEKTIEFLIEFSKKIPEKKILIKPHPNEKIGFWKNLVEKQNFKNIKVLEEINISTNSLVLASDCVIACNSTLILETHFLNKRCINYLPVAENKLVEKDVLIKASKTIRNLDELIEQLKDINSFKNENDTNKLKHYVSNYGEDSLSSEIIANCIDNLEIKSFNSIYKKTENSKKILVQSIVIKIKSIIKKLLNFKSKSSEQQLLVKLHNRKIGNYMNVKNFNNRVSLISNIIGEKQIKTKELIPNVFKLMVR